MKPKSTTVVRAVFAIAAAAGAVFVTIEMRPHGVSAEEPYGDGYKDYLGRTTVPVTVRQLEFDPSHPDFNIEPTAGGGRYAGIMAPRLDADRRPIFQSTGFKVLEDWTDAQGRSIAPPTGNTTQLPGDTAGLLDQAQGGAITSASTFDQWYNPQVGVSQWSNSTLDFNMGADGTYVMETSMDGGPGAAEMEWGFVHEAGRDNYLTIETDAEAWVYIDGRLVIDGGGVGEVIEFEIVDGVVVPGSPFKAKLQIAGAAFADMPITTMLRVGTSELEPFGSLNDPADGNVDDGNNPRNWAPSTVYPAGTPISMVAKSWTSTSTSSHRMTVDSRDNSQQVYVLRDGDPVPDIKPYENQSTIDSYLQDYLDADTGLVTLASNQIIYLFELWTTDLTHATADFQDLVVIVTLAAEGSDSSSSTSSNDSSFNTAPRLTQTIDLSRLDWLQDRHPYRIQVFYANRTGAESDLRIETNLRTLNVLNAPAYDGKD